MEIYRITGTASSGFQYKDADIGIEEFNNGYKIDGYEMVIIKNNIYIKKELLKKINHGEAQEKEGRGIGFSSARASAEAHLNQQIIQVMNLELDTKFEGVKTGETVEVIEIKLPLNRITGTKLVKANDELKRLLFGKVIKHTPFPIV